MAILDALLAQSGRLAVPGKEYALLRAIAEHVAENAEDFTHFPKLVQLAERAVAFPRATD